MGKKIFIYGYIGKEITGIGRCLIETLKAMAEIEPECSFVLYTNYDNLKLGNSLTSLKARFITVKYFPVSKNSTVLNLISNTLAMPFLVLYEKADLIYLPNIVPILFHFRPVVTVIHDLIEFRIKKKFSFLRILYRSFALPRMANVAKRIITVSHNSKKDIIELLHIDPNKITVIYNGAPQPEIYRTEKKVVNYNYILHVGTVDHPGKNLYNTIKAFELFKSKSKSLVKLVICGQPGKGFQIIEQLILSSKFNYDILYLGYVNQAELIDYYKNATGFVFISYYEGFGLPILEAMSYGIPVITANRSSLPEVAGDAAILCDPDNLQEISQAMAQVTEYEILRQELIAKGFKNLQRFSWKQTASKTLKIFNEQLT